jgi:hypothetical protein
VSHIKAEPPTVSEEGQPLPQQQQPQEQKLVPQTEQAVPGDILSRESSVTVPGTCQQLPGASTLRMRRLSVSQSRPSENARSCIADTSWDEVINAFFVFLYTTHSESRCALGLQYVHLVVSIEVAVEVCCCSTVFSCLNNG